MTIGDMKELYKSGDWICLVLRQSEYEIMMRPTFSQMIDGGNGYNLIHKKHEHILDAYLDGCEVYVKCKESNKYFTIIKDTVLNFIEDYNEKYSYEAVPKTLEKCYCDASKLHYIELSETFKDGLQGYQEHLEYDAEYFFIDGEFEIDCFSSDYEHNFKKIQFNKQLKQWTYCPYEKEEAEDDNSWDAVDADPNAQPDSPTGTITDGINVNNFKDYGFEGNFKGEILKEINSTFIGYIIFDRGFVAPILWDTDGKVIDLGDYPNKLKYNLTPFKKEWYENENMMGKYAITTDTNEMFIVDGLIKNSCIESKYEFREGARAASNYCDINSCRLATKEEVDSLYYKGK